MATARLAGDLKIELAAAEPNVVDPVAAAALIRWPQQRTDSVRICDRSVPQAGISSRKPVCIVPANSYN